MKQRFLNVLFVLLSFSAFSQQHLSVPLTDPVYQILDNALLRNYCSQLIGMKPYSVATVLRALNEIIDSPHAQSVEKEIAQRTIKRLNPYDKKKWQDRGNYRYSNADKDHKVLNSLEIGGFWETDVRTNVNVPSISSDHWLTFYFQGDLSNYFSYNVNMSLGITTHSFDAYAPYSFSQTWDGYQYSLHDLGAFVSMSENPAGGAQFKPELSVSLWDNKVGINFSRIRRDWGFADGNLMLSKTARPFMAFDMYFNPVKWFNLSFIAGGLEYRMDDGIKTSSLDFQNNYSATMIEFFIGKWAYISANYAVVYTKRLEFGYLHPGMFLFYYQNMVGDFDNMLFGLNIGANIPKLARIYFSFLLSETDLQKDAFFKRERSMYAWQTGIKSALPNIPFGNLTIQYTKVHPYMYTHARSTAPVYGEKNMNTNYINHGEGIGYYLQPNSDEAKIKFETTPFWFLTTSFSYGMIRHGLTKGENESEGNWFDGKWTYDDLGFKDFLKDGIYDWTHTITLNAEYDMRHINFPMTLGVGYTFIYRQLTEWKDGQFSVVDSVIARGRKYSTGFSNIFSLYVKLY